jgi:CDGSH-type Zn-finger protein
VTWFCGCKATGRAPLCDGKHKALLERGWRALIGRAAMEGASAAAPPAPCRRSARASA